MPPRAGALRRERILALADAVGLHLLRFAIMMAVLAVAPLVGITGWDAGLAVNVVLTLVAIALITRRRLWRSTGLTTAWRSWLALAALTPFVLELVIWVTPDGVTPQPPGHALWALTLLLVGINEELFSRGLVLTRLRGAYRTWPAVAITAALFGLQHLSALVLTSRGTVNVLGNVVLSASFGFALAAFQVRFAWLWPLILVHGAADWVSILATRTLSDWNLVAIHLGYLGFGWWLLRGRPSASPDPP